MRGLKLQDTAVNLIANQKLSAPSTTIPIINLKS